MRITMRYVIYDIEVYPNLFLLTVKDVITKEIRTFEISPRKNEARKIVSLLNTYRLNGTRMIGYNNYGYDYPVLHLLIAGTRLFNNANLLMRQLYLKSKDIIENNKDTKFTHMVWDNQQVVPQVDLFKIHHFDNKARSTSLKMLEFNMRSKSIQDLPFIAGERLTKASQIERLITYNIHDVEKTYDFFNESHAQITFREHLSKQYNRNFMNHNDTKIGKDYFIMQLEKVVNDEICYRKINGRKVVNQTPRNKIVVKDILFPYIEFKHPEFKRIHNLYKRMVITDDVFKHDKFKNILITFKNVFNPSSPDNVFKDKLFIHRIDEFKKLGISGTDPKSDIGQVGTEVFKNKQFTKWLQSFTPPLGTKIINKLKSVLRKGDNRSAVVDGFSFDFGKGGVHGSISSALVVGDNEYVIVDIDAKSYYPDISIQNELYPQHLGRAFCNSNKQMFDRRSSYDKGTPENAMLKLALNGVYGDSNSIYSPFYDPQYMMAITINGQLMLCMLAEKLLEVSGLSIIQINTDGITMRMPRKANKEVSSICQWWQKLTKLTLEQAIYSRMWVRDVNNYICEYKEGGLKRKGAYEYELDWHKNFSSLIVQKAVEAELVNGIPCEKFIAEHNDIFDFFLRTKVNRTSKLMINTNGKDKEYQRVTRYLVTNTGGKLVKIMPPLGDKVDDRRIGINVSYVVTPYNNVESTDINDYDINYQFYIDECKKLLKPFDE